MGGQQGGSTATGRKREVYMKNKTFPLITSVTSRLYPGIIFQYTSRCSIHFLWGH